MQTISRGVWSRSDASDVALMRPSRAASAPTFAALGPHTPTGCKPGTPCTARMCVSVMLPPPVKPTRIVTGGLWSGVALEPSI